MPPPDTSCSIGSSQNQSSSMCSRSSKGSPEIHPSPSSFEMDMNDETETSDITNHSHAIVAAEPSHMHNKPKHVIKKPPVDYIHLPEKTSDNGNTTTLRRSAPRFMGTSMRDNFKLKSCISTFCFMLAMYFLGSISDHVTTTTKLKEVEAARDKLVQNRERLLLKLASDLRLSMENIEVQEHVSLLQDELEKTTLSLGAERKQRQEFQLESKRAWAKYKAVTSELSDVEMTMQDDIGKMFQTLAMEQFGPGPHYAEFEVHVWENDQVEARYFTVETTPIEHMPASVFLFLQQVDNGLWDQASFRVNAPHAILAQPLTSHSVEEQPFTKMERMGFAHVLFEDYNGAFPHTPYTLGYSGRRLAGPNFYINKVDNSDHHQGEPCFAKVIIGTDTIDRMGKLSGPAENPYYIRPVDIARVRLVRDLHQVHGGTDYMNSRIASDGSQALHEEL